MTSALKQTLTVRGAGSGEEKERKAEVKRHLHSVNKTDYSEKITVISDKPESFGYDLRASLTNKAVYTAALVAGGWAGAVMS